MRVLIFHGYLLGGTGSNVYNSELAEALVRGGHEVHLLCQDRDPLALEWVDAAADWDAGALAVRVRREPVRATVYRPDIGGLLPVYVADRYEGFEARPFQDLSAAEVDRYLDANVAAVREVAERVRARRRPRQPPRDGAGRARPRPRRGGVPYAMKIHGSALEYTVKPHPRFRPFALAGLERARGVLVGSRHTGREPVDRDGRPGAAGPHAARPAGRRRRAVHAARAGRGAGRLRRACASGWPRWTRPRQRPTTRSRARPARRRRRSPPSSPDDRLVVFVGKLIASKGVELLLAAWPLVLAREPRARLLVVGFGAFREALEGLARDLGGATWTPRGRCAASTAASCRTWPPSSTRSRSRTPTAPPPAA